MGGVQTGDMNSLILLVKKKRNPSAVLLLGIVEFIGRSKGCWLIGKAGKAAVKRLVDV